MNKELAAGVVKAEERQAKADKEFDDTHGANSLTRLH